MKIWLALLLLGVCLNVVQCKRKHQRRLKIKGVSLENLKKNFVLHPAHGVEKNEKHLAIDPHRGSSDTEARIQQEDMKAFIKAYGSRKKKRKNHSRHSKDRAKKNRGSSGRFRRAIARTAGQ